MKILSKILPFLLIIVLASCEKSEEVLPKVSSSEKEIQKGKVTKTININGTTREYIVYIPKNYDGKKAYPLVLTFHGLGGTMETSFSNSKLHLVAENENFIVVYPNGISKRWNAVSANNNADIDFTRTLLNQLQNDYNIESKRIYSTGMSNGGYFSFLLACELSDKIAAIASVTGLMFQPVLNNCQPTRPIAVLQIHGTADNVVDYSGVDEVLNFWINHNNSNITPTIENIPNTNIGDRSTVKRFRYENGDEDVEVQHLKVIGGGHDWPGHAGNMDIDASQEVWNFIKNYNLDGKIE